MGSSSRKAQRAGKGAADPDFAAASSSSVADKSKGKQVETSPTGFRMPIAKDSAARTGDGGPGRRSDSLPLPSASGDDTESKGKVDRNGTARRQSSSPPMLIANRDVSTAAEADEAENGHDAPDPVPETSPLKTEVDPTISAMMESSMLQIRRKLDDYNQDSKIIQDSIENINLHFRTVCQALSHETNGLEEIVHAFDRASERPPGEAYEALENQTFIARSRNHQLDTLTGKIKRIANQVSTHYRNISAIMYDGPGPLLLPDFEGMRADRNHSWVRQFDYDILRLGGVWDAIACRFDVPGAHDASSMRACKSCKRSEFLPTGKEAPREPNVWAFAVYSTTEPLNKTMQDMQKVLAETGCGKMVAPISRDALLVELGKHPNAKRPARPGLMSRQDHETQKTESSDTASTGTEPVEEHETPQNGSSETASTETQAIGKQETHKTGSSDTAIVGTESVCEQENQEVESSNTANTETEPIEKQEGQEPGPSDTAPTGPSN